VDEENQTFAHQGMVLHEHRQRHHQMVADEHHPCSKQFDKHLLHEKITNKSINV
jgi:hypothetical protein